MKGLILLGMVLCGIPALIAALGMLLMKWAIDGTIGMDEGVGLQNGGC